MSGWRDETGKVIVVIDGGLVALSLGGEKPRELKVASQEPGFYRLEDIDCETRRVLQQKDGGIWHLDGEPLPHPIKAIGAGEVERLPRHKLGVLLHDPVKNEHIALVRIQSTLSSWRFQLYVGPVGKPLPGRGTVQTVLDPSRKELVLDLGGDDVVSKVRNTREVIPWSTFALRGGRRLIHNEGSARQIRQLDTHNRNWQYKRYGNDGRAFIALTESEH